MFNHWYFIIGVLQLVLGLDLTCAVLNIPHILYYVYFVLTYAILNISHIYTMYILYHTYLFPCNKLVIGFYVFNHVIFNSRFCVFLSC